MSHHTVINAGENWSVKTFETHPFVFFTAEEGKLIGALKVTGKPATQIPINFAIRNSDSGITIKSL